MKFEEHSVYLIFKFSRISYSAEAGMGCDKLLSCFSSCLLCFLRIKRPCRYLVSLIFILCNTLCVGKGD